MKPVMNLHVSEAQEQFIASNARSIAEAYFAEDAWFRAIYADDTPVGFTMMSLIPEKSEYFLWRFMIDARYQGRGYAKAAIHLLIDHVNTLPNATNFYVSYKRGEGGPEGFYLKLGFVPTGDVDDGEVLAKLRLRD